VATTSQIEKEFFSEHKQSVRLARRRLKKLYDAKLLKRERSHVNYEYVYYLQKPSQIRHQLLVVDFYQKIKKYGTIMEFAPEKSMGDIRPDAVCKIVKNNQLHLFCVEVELSNNGFDQEKYEAFYYSRKYQEWFLVFPKVIIISDKKTNIAPSKIRFIQLSTEMKYMESIFK